MSPIAFDTCFLFVMLLEQIFLYCKYNIFIFVQVNHARNLWDRAVTILPRVNQFWYKYTYMEEMLENIPGARAVFERWMEWQPDEQAWQTYINFELRYKEIDRARQIYERYIT